MPNSFPMLFNCETTFADKGTPSTSERASASCSFCPAHNTRLCPSATGVSLSSDKSASTSFLSSSGSRNRSRRIAPKKWQTRALVASLSYTDFPNVPPLRIAVIISTRTAKP